MKPFFHLITSMRRSRRGVTLLQVLVVIALMAALGSLGIPTFNRTRAVANRNRCDVQLKSIALALDAYRQAHGHFPVKLAQLQSEQYLKDPSELHCPCDPRPDASYEDFYVLRSRDEGSQLPVLMCPFHEKIGGGNQARVGLYTTQFATRPAHLEAANGVSVESPGQKPRTGYDGMELHGGDRVYTAGAGGATLVFADGSKATLQQAGDITVLQSFIDGHQSAPLYTVLRQNAGQALYTVHHGSHFDVTTATATAGARGTQFQIKVDSDPAAVEAGEGTQLYVIEGKVAFTGGKKTVIAPLRQWTAVKDVGSIVGGLLGGLGGLFGH